jgi:hypothetical protein
MITQLASIAHILLNASPIIASALGSPLAGVAISLVSHAFGVDSGKPEELISKVMEDVPQATTILQSLESQHGDILKSLLSGVNNLASAEINIKLNWNKTDQG